MIVSTRVTQESPHRYTSWKSSDEEKRKLRCSLASKDRGLKRQKEKVRDFEKELRQSKQDIENRDDRINVWNADIQWNYTVYFNTSKRVVGYVFTFSQNKKLTCAKVLI